MTDSARRKSGFTLVEMLLVIAIIALLSVLLLAALRSARSTARLAQCMANVKNLGTGLHSFAVRNKSYGMPGAPNAFCNGTTITNVDADGAKTTVSTAGPQAGVAPNTLWTSSPQTGDLQIYNTFLPVWGYLNASGQRTSRFVNHGLLFKNGEVNDERVYSCPDMEGLYTADAADANSFARTLGQYVTNPDPVNAPLSPVPTSTLAWMSSYDYRSCFDPGVPLYNGTNVNQDHSGQGDRAADFKGPYGPINLGKMGAESPVFCDTIQNPAGLKLAHENRRYNVIYADGHGSVFQDESRATPFATTGAFQYQPTATTTGKDVDTIASMGLSIASTQNYWYWNERVWAQLFVNP